MSIKNNEKKLLYSALFILLIVVVFCLHINKGVEIAAIIFVVIGIIWLISRTTNKNKMTPLSYLIFFVGGGAFIGLMYWHINNEHIRSEEEAEKMVRDAKIKHKIEAQNKDRENIIKEKRIAEQSELLYKQEGDRVFGNFFFGMSKKDFDKEVNSIKKETDGLISIQGTDFYIEQDKCDFFHDKLYRITLISKKQDYIDYDMTPDEKREWIEFNTKWLLGLFEEKYGKAHDDNGWHFAHKDIDVSYSCINPFEDENVELRRWASFIRITQPTLSSEAARERNEEDMIKQQQQARMDSLKKVKEKEILKKKEAFGEGI